MLKAIRLPGMTGNHIAEDCFDLPTKTNREEFQKHTVPAVTSAWRLSPEQMVELIANGGVIFVTIIGGQPPLRVELTPPEGVTNNLTSADFEQFVEQL